MYYFYNYLKLLVFMAILLCISVGIVIWTVSRGGKKYCWYWSQIAARRVCHCWWTLFGESEFYPLELKCLKKYLLFSSVGQRVRSSFFHQWRLGQFLQRSRVCPDEVPQGKNEYNQSYDSGNVAFDLQGERHRLCRNSSWSVERNWMWLTIFYFI